MKISIGLSGGVDSSVAAYLLKEQGHEVTGLFMYNWEETDSDGVCSSEADYEDVKKVCAILDIPYYSVNFAKEYLDRVFSYFLKEYSLGRTPNPDVLCNREIKFGPFLDYALGLGAQKIATGHYCGVSEIEGKFYLDKAADSNKDQTYFLNQLSQYQLSKVIFPLANITKPEVRKIAQKLGLSTAMKKDSTGICFIGERKFKEFLKNYLPAKPGDIIDTNGNKIGTHDGLMYYTLGQRRGLGIGGIHGSNGRWFVIDKDLKNNHLIVSCQDESLLYSKALITYSVNWIPQAPAEEFECYAKFRYRQDEQKVRVKKIDNGYRIDFFEKQRAVTPGQYVVFYDDVHCLGGGVIEEVIK
ncbi:MAG TPA: tRNA 2-thiouridine(34) synthase MnmA [Clostridia bacterium]